MFNNLFKQFIKESKQIKLTKEQKSQGCEQLLNFINANPVRTDLTVRHRGLWSNILINNFLIANWRTKLMPALLTIILTLAVTGGVTVASQGAVPGDTLYPVKIKSEEVRSSLTFSAQSRAELETKLAHERLKEAEELSAESRLDEYIRIQLEENFEKHANRVQQRTNEFSEVDAKAAASISSNFEVSLKAHDRILTKLAENRNGTTAPQINKLLLKIRAQTKNANQNKLLIQSRKNLNLEIKSDSNINSNTEIGDEKVNTSNQIKGGLKVRLGL